MAVKWKWNNNTGGGNVPAGLENRVQTLENEAVKLSGAQNISGVKTITASGGEVLKFNSGTNSSAYIAGFKSGNSRIWYFGKGSSTDDDFVIGSTATIKLQASSSIHCNSKKLTNVAEPTANTDAATKQYVDNRIKYRVVDVVINNNQQSQINPTSGYQIINIRVGRKRTSEGYFFYDHNINLNFQTFIHTNGNFVVYNNGGVSGFDNNFKILITEMKV